MISGIEKLLHESKTILVATDFSEESAKAFRHACLFAREYGATIHLFHSCGTYGQEFSAYALQYLETLGTPRLPSLVALAEAEMKEFLARYPAKEVTVKTKIAEIGPVAEQILKYSEEIHAELLVVGTHGKKGLSRLALGSVAEKVIRRTKTPVLIVRADQDPKSEQLYRSYRKILIATDFSRHGDFTVTQGLHLAKRLNANVDILHVVDGRIFVPIKTIAVQTVVQEYERELAKEAKTRLDGYLETLTNAKDFLGLHVTVGTPSEEIVATCKRLACDLVILGSHGHAKVSNLFMGSTAERVAHSACCPVLIIK